jgi:hypothetical protein
MKKLFLLIPAVLFGIISSSQTLLNESFDGTTFPPVGWTNLQVSGTGTTSVWSRVTAGTNPICTTQSGAGMAAYNCYNYSSGKSAILASPSIDLTGVGANTATISFWMYRDNAYSSTYDSVDVYVSNSVNITGAAHLGKINRSRSLAPSESADGWYNYSLDIPPSYNGTTNYIIFKATSLYGNDIYIDDISVIIPVANDAGITVFNEPLPTIFAGGGNVSVTVKNFGTQNLTSATIAWSINGVLQTPQPYTNAGLAQNATEASVYIGSHNISTPGFHELKAWTENPNGTSDDNYSNDTAVTTVYLQDYAPLPFAENFDPDWIDKFSNHDVPSGYWTNTPNFGNDSWRRDDDGASGGWGSLTSGTYFPSGAEGSLHSARFHTYSAQADLTATLDLFLDFSQAGNKVLKFWYNNVTETGGYDSLGLWLSTDGGTNFTFVQQFQFADVWTENTVPLGNSTSANIILRFIGTSDYYSTDIGLDNISIYTVQPIDVGVSAALSPVSSLCGFMNDSVIVVVENFGTDTQSNIPVDVTINTPSGPFIFNGTITGPLAQNESDTLFLGYIITTEVGSYYLNAYTSLTGDITAWNDTVNFVFITSSALTVPHLEDFESTSPLTNWNTNMSVGNGHGNSSYAMYKNLWSSSNDTAIATMNQKVGLITAETTLSFDYRYTNYTGGTAYTLDHDTLRVFLSNDCGYTFTPIYTVDSIGHIPTVDSTHIEIPIGAFAGSNVIVKFIASWGGSGDYYIDIDNVFFSKPCSIELGIDTTVCENLSVVLDAGAGFTTYAWSTGENTQTITVDTTGIGSGSFSYYVDVTSPFCTTSDTITVNFTPCTGIVDNNLSTGFDIFPNPTTGITNITVKGFTNADVIIYNMQGAIIYTERINSDKTTVIKQLDLNFLPEGMYLIRITDSKSTVSSRLIIQ